MTMLHQSIFAAHAAPLSPARQLIREVLDGKAKPYGPNGYYETGDWAWAAQCAEDTNDLSEIELMMAREEAYEAFRNWQAEARSDAEWAKRDATDFDDWRERQSSWERAKALAARWAA